MGVRLFSELSGGGQIGFSLTEEQKQIEARTAQRILSIKQEVNEFRAMSGGIQAVDKNIDRTLASIVKKQHG